MGLEKVALEVVAKIVKQDDTAYFAYGTMFVPGITAAQAAKIETALIDKLRCGIIVSKAAEEFCFDFL